MPPIWSNSRRRRLQAIARGLRLVAFDVDGVMTDGGIFLIGAGEEARRFDVRDGMGVVLARSAGLRTAIDRYGVANCTRAQPVFYGFARLDTTR